MRAFPHLNKAIKAEAQRLGFLLAGITGPESPPHFREYRNWIEHGHHAAMAYLASDRHLAARQDPALLMPEVRSILCLALPYANPRDAKEPTQSPSGRVSSYAWGRDYHDVLEVKLQEMAAAITRLAGREVGWKAFTDSGPLLERDLAQRSGLGWIGKNTMLIHPEHGSYFFLTEMLLDLDLEPDLPFTTDHCGTCRRCIEACPTDAIREDRTLEAGRCISYLTIENKGDIPPELAPNIGEWIFGCDICQMVCPWNLRFAGSPSDPALESDPGNAYILLPEELDADDHAFRQKFRGRALLRPKRFGFLRNILVVLTNRPDPEAIQALTTVLFNENDPRLRALSARALGGIAGSRDMLLKAAQKEQVDFVQVEIKKSLARQVVD